MSWGAFILIAWLVAGAFGSVIAFLLAFTAVKRWAGCL